MTRAITARAGDIGHCVTADLWYSIEQDYDFLYAEYSTDSGNSWTQVGPPITGVGHEVGRASAGRSKPPVTRRPSSGSATHTDGGFNRGRCLPRRHRASRSARRYASTTAPRAATNGWTVDGLEEPPPAPRSTSGRALLPDREPSSTSATTTPWRWGPYKFDKAYTAARLGRALPLPDRHAGLAGRPAATPTTTPSTHPGAGYALPVDARPNTLTYCGRHQPEQPA